MSTKRFVAMRSRKWARRRGKAWDRREIWFEASTFSDVGSGAMIQQHVRTSPAWDTYRERFVRDQRRHPVPMTRAQLVLCALAMEQEFRREMGLPLIENPVELLDRIDQGLHVIEKYCQDPVAIATLRRTPTD